MSTLQQALVQHKRAQFLDDEHVGVIIQKGDTYDFLLCAPHQYDREGKGATWEELKKRLRTYRMPPSRGWEASH